MTVEDLSSRQRSEMPVVHQNRPEAQEACEQPMEGMHVGDLALKPKVCGDAIADLWGGIHSWRIWAMLAGNDIRTRYRRSSLGQFWLTLSMGIMIAGLGIVYSTLFKTDAAKYVPYLAVSFVCWNLISTTVTESCTAFVDNHRIMLHADCAKSTFIFRLVHRNLIVLAHNALIIPVVFLVYSMPVSWTMLWFIPGFLLVIGNVFWIAFCLAIVCARYRDVPQIISSAMQLVFFVTPIMYMPDQLSDRLSVIVKWNPFANLLQLMTKPLLNEQLTLWQYQYCIVLFVVGASCSLWFVNKYSKRVVYWL